MKFLFKGTKSRGNDWDTFINDSHFKSKTKEDIYGIIHTISGKDIWVYVYDKETNELLDTSTWGFKKEDLEEVNTDFQKNKNEG